MRAVLNQINKIPNYEPQPYTGPSFEDTLALHKNYMFPFYKTEYKTPLFIVEGKGQYLYTNEGRRYLDLMAGVATVNVGHSHPRILKAFNDQVQKIIHTSSIYMHQYHGAYCKALCNQLGQGFQVAYLCNSGSEANDFASMLVKLYTGNESIFALRNAYHGVSGNAYAMTNVTSRNSPLPKNSHVQKLAFPALYRSSHSVDTLLEDAEEAMSCNASFNGRIGGLWVQPIMGAGGMYPLPGQNYFKRLAEIAKKHHGLVVSDEVQTGFGRVGKEYWGFKVHDVKPDIVVTAKAMANGYPMGAVITSKKIMQGIKHSVFNTYGGGPIQCRLGLEVLDIIREQKLAENSENIGNFLLKELKKVSENHPYVGDIRGKGMMMGIQFVNDKISKIPNPEICTNVLEHMKQNGVLLGKTKPHILRMVGPLCITMQDAKQFVDAFEQALKVYY